jgi:hypothetical protein
VDTSADRLEQAHSLGVNGLAVLPASAVAGVGEATVMKAWSELGVTFEARESDETYEGRYE